MTPGEIEYCVQHNIDGQNRQYVMDVIAAVLDDVMDSVALAISEYAINSHDPRMARVMKSEIYDTVADYVDRSYGWVV